MDHFGCQGNPLNIKQNVSHMNSVLLLISLLEYMIELDS